MRPPLCVICRARFAPRSGGKLLRFVRSEAGRRFEARVATERIVGHHPDDGWFCAKHQEAAEALHATHTLGEAVRDMRKRSD